MKLIKDPFLPMPPFSAEHHYSLLNILFHYKGQLKQKLIERMKITKPTQMLL